MQGIMRDSASDGLAKYATLQETATFDQVVDQQSMATMSQRNTFTAFVAVEANLPFITLLVAWLALWLLRPQIYCAREFYKHCFTQDCRYGPWRRWLFDLIWCFVDIAFVIGIVHYLFVYEPGSQDSDSVLDRYIAVFAVALILFLLRWFWINSFWNYHNLKNKRGNDGKPVFDYSAGVAIAVALVLAVLMIAAIITLIVLTGIEHDWLAMVMMIINLIWAFFVLAWTGIVYSCVQTCPSPSPQPGY